MLMLSLCEKTRTIEIIDFLVVINLYTHPMRNPYIIFKEYRLIQLMRNDLYADRSLVTLNESTPDQRSGKQSLSDSQQWVFTLMVGYRSRTPNPSAA